MITESTYREAPPELDGSRIVFEKHVDDRGREYTYQWQGAQDAGPVLAARAAKLNELIAEQRAAEVQVAGTKLPLTKFQFRKLFTGAEIIAIDDFNANFEAHPALTAEQKKAIRSGLEDWKTSGDVVRPFLPELVQMLNMYAALGILTPERLAEVLAHG